MRNVWMPCVALLVLGFPCLSASAQFGVAPTDSLVAAFTTDSVPRIFQIDFPNETPDSLGLTWRRVGGGWTEGWEVNLCDLGECYTGVPSDADMLPMPAEGAGFLKLIVNAYELEGECVLHFWVWPTGNQDALVNVYFDLRNGAVSGLSDPQWTADIALYPNPVRSGAPVVLTPPNFQANLSFRPMQRLGPDGKFHPCIPSLDAAGWSLSTEGWTPGLHWIQWSESHAPLRLIVE